ncbi:MAG TPA: hypothetical protein VJN69_15030 [Candidatus Acidoferrales bacterium]|nr:hypothetical protein [Candidatus Acidoferrales bacterium]
MFVGKGAEAGTAVAVTGAETGFAMTGALGTGVATIGTGGGAWFVSDLLSVVLASSLAGSGLTASVFAG